MSTTRIVRLNPDMDPVAITRILLIRFTPNHTAVVARGTVERRDGQESPQARHRGPGFGGGQTERERVQAACQLLCASNAIYSDVTADFRNLHDRAHLRPLDWPPIRRILLEREVSACLRSRPRSGRSPTRASMGVALPAPTAISEGGTVSPILAQRALRVIQPTAGTSGPRPDQVVAPARGEHPANAADAPLARLAEQRDGLGPAEDLLDQLPLPLADRIAAVPGLVVEEPMQIAAPIEPPPLARRYFRTVLRDRPSFRAIARMECCWPASSQSCYRRPSQDGHLPGRDAQERP
jgi:hypothetical protein